MVNFLDGMTLEDLTPVVEERESNLIEPTDEEKLQIVELLKQGVSHKRIKKEVRRVEEDAEGKQLSAKGFSFGQIKEIELVWRAKLAELRPEEELEE